eukprot:gnl/MRDRNA2_/MRDRNA2_49116_c0_seq1.p1 gnl/MRDRNA2_/MRDRNA2_49116_c0~~gnl/MRDRNA2_/MRDRNA2_49116_c0_seq1.p1  ORF type:complete len:587 (+),score=114.43 gnl/MRDRNA2_/MRDRNA2_49116_c0_seq1:77-1837(+)
MPNHNSYLAVVLDDATEAALGIAAEAIVASPSELLGARSVGFEPVQDESRHMTFVFFGEHLRQLPASELLAVHAAICEEVAAAGASAAAPLAFRGFELFPPTKSNLIVACFEPSPFLVELRNAVLRRVRECGLSLSKSLFTMLEGDGAWMPHVTLGKIRASKAQIGGVSCSHAAFHSLGPTAPALPKGLTLLGERPPRAWCNWDSALEFGRDRTEADSQDADAAHCMADQAFSSPSTFEVDSIVPMSKECDTADANPSEKSAPERLHDEVAEDAWLPRWSGDLFVKCRVHAVSSTRKQGRFLVEVQQADSGACIQLVATRTDVAVGQLWVVALPGATLEDGQLVKQVKIAGEWSEGALVEIIPQVASCSKKSIRQPQITNDHPENEEASSDASGDTEGHSSKYHVLPGIKYVRDSGISQVADRKTARDRLHFVTGDATVVQYGKGQKIITHVCNDRGRWGKGFVMAISRKWPEAARMYRQWYKAGGKEGFALGAVQLIELNPSLTLANMIGQNGIKTGSKGPPVRYDAIGEALMAVSAHAVSEGASIHMPLIGTGLAGGEWQQIEDQLLTALERYSVHAYVYEFSS